MSKKKEIEVKKAKGTLKNDKKHAGLVLPAIDSIPEPPVHLGEFGKAVWFKTLNVLLPEKTVSEIDLKVYEEYCYQFDLIEALRPEMDKGGVLPIVNNGGGQSMIKNPAFTVYADCVDRVHKLAQQFGLTPLSRSKIAPSHKPKEKSPESKAEDILESLKSGKPLMKAG